jgi:chloramphenicol-sensitive protein RarD
VAETRRGFVFGLSAYAMWGLFPLYWPLLEPAGAVEILANRIFWSLAVVGVLIFATGRARQLRAVLADRRTRKILAVAAVVIAINWGTFIWGVNNGHVVETSLGYFINPLVTVLIGVLVLGERLRRLQWLAMGIAAVAVVGLTVQFGRLPWVALVLAFSFGTYGLMKKKANTGAVESLTVETLALSPLALGYLIWLSATGASHFTGHGTGHTLLLVGTGVVTAVPLLCFGAAATRVPLTAIGLMQYVTPTLQFLIGVFIDHEPMPAMRWVGFVLIWIALAVFTAELISHRRRELRMSVDSMAV